MGLLGIPDIPKLEKENNARNLDLLAWWAPTSSGRAVSGGLLTVGVGFSLVGS